MKIPHISVSRKSVWDQCTQKYKYQYELELKPQIEHEYFVYGKIVHRIAEVYVDLKGERSIWDVMSDVLDGAILLENRKEEDVSNDKEAYLKLIAPPLSPEYKKKLPDHVRSIEKLTETMGFGGQLEWPFLHDLDPPNQKFVKGFIDRIVEKNGKIYIIDYKTTKKGGFRKNEKTILKDLQLRTYARMVQKYFGVDPEDIRCALYYVDGSNLIGAKYSQEALLEAERELLDTYNSILNTPPEASRGRVANHCERCEFSRSCVFYRSDGQGIR